VETVAKAGRFSCRKSGTFPVFEIVQNNMRLCMWLETVECGANVEVICISELYWLKFIIIQITEV
jgi:hypothetical protein